MILRDLCDLYDLKRESDPQAIPERYWCTKTVMWEIVIDANGLPVSVVSLVDEGERAGQKMEVPDVHRTSGIRPFFLCDDATYFLGRDEKRGSKKLEQSRELHELVLGQLIDEGARSALLFFHNAEVYAHEDIFEQYSEGGLAVLRLQGDKLLVHERPAIKKAWAEYNGASEDVQGEGICLVTGHNASFARLFPQVSGLPGAQSSGASLVSFNVNAFCSYGQATSTAGSMSAEAAFKAGTALSYVLKNRGHSVRVGNDYIAFWTDAKDLEMDEELAFLFEFDAPVRDEDQKLRESIQTSLLQLRAGKRPVAIDADTQYHLLGIAPYQARLAVRFYETGALVDLWDKVGQFLRDTEMVGVKPCTLRSYLAQVAVLGDAKNVPSTLITPCMRALIHGSPFPTSLLRGVLQRMRADHGTKNAWDMGRRAAILRACLLRNARSRGFEQGKETERRLTVSLNQENNNQGYLLGRLFALLEKVQQDAIGGANATIRDRFMGAAATTPARVYPQLLKLAQHHISKSNYGGLIDRRIQEVMDQLGDGGFPKTLSFDDQGMFYIGYYQQKQELYTRKNGSTSIETEED